MSFRRVLVHIGVNLLVAGPVFLSLIFYMQLVIGGRMGLGAIVFTFWFLVSIYIGRYLAIQVPAENKKRLNALIIGFSLLAFTCIVALGIFGAFAYGNGMVYNIVVFALPVLLLGVMTGAVIKLVRKRIGFQLQEAKVATEHSRSELQLLQSQMSPHFLFNTLNNLYGISITRPEKIPPLLLKLSDLLRYAVYDTKELLVPLKNELAYIGNYIDFEQLRMGTRLVLHTDIAMDFDPGMQIAPMLLIVFVENAFKHSKNTVAEKIYISIELEVSGDTIVFSTRNSQSDRNAATTQNKSSSGLGLANVQKRLELLYANRHQLTIDNQETFYQATLQLTTG